MISEFTIDQLIELSKFGNDIGVLASEELRRKLMPPQFGLKKSVREKATSAGFFNTEYSEFADDCKVTVPAGWHIFKGTRELNWTDKDMLNFVGIAISKDEAYLKNLLEEYRNCDADAHD
jgi:hypothetical protein